jgi:hypothetical protein
LLATGLASINKKFLIGDRRFLAASSEDLQYFRYFFGGVLRLFKQQGITIQNLPAFQQQTGFYLGFRGLIRSFNKIK